MNILFRDKLSQQAWHATRRFNDAHREQLDRWLSDFLAGAWCDHQLPETLEGYGRPDWEHQTGGMGQLLIHAPWNTLELVNGKLVAHEFSWSVARIRVDEYGHPNGEAKTVIFGGFIDHSRDPDKPRWSSHT
jgi:hypothetical protein